MTPEEVDKRISEMRAMLDAFQKEYKQLESPKFEVGKWYKEKDGDGWLLVCNDKKDTYGFWSGTWGVDWSFDNDLIVESVPATDKEVEEALIKEYYKKGYKKGKFKDIRGGKVTNNMPFDKEYFVFDSDNNFLFVRGCGYVFEHGKWAEIIKDEPIKVGSYEVKKCALYTLIGCKKITHDEIDNISDFMHKHNFKKVAFDGIEVDLETIEKILKL